MLVVMGQVPIYLIIDALDECPDDSGIPPLREKVLELVKELVELRHPTLRLCVTSRPEFDIRTTLEPLASQQVSLHDESGQKQDINNYVTSVVCSDKKMKRWRDHDKNMVVEKLTEKADGMSGNLPIMNVPLSDYLKQVSMGFLPIGGSAALFPSQSASCPGGIAKIT